MAWSEAAAAGVGFLGQWSANRANRREARRNREFQAQEADRNRSFQERMRNSQWQAAVADMQAAGINPALAYSQGPAAAPGGSMGAGSQAVPAGDVVSSAMQAMQMRKTLQIMDATRRKTEAEADTASAQSRIERARSHWLTDYSPSGRDRAPLFDILESEVANATAGASNMRAMADRNRALATTLGPMAGLADRFGEMLPILSLLMAPGGPASALVGRGLRKFKLPTWRQRNRSGDVKWNSRLDWDYKQYLKRRGLHG